MGVGREAIVPFLFPKSSWTVVAILGILKAGTAPVGLNSEFPLNRLLHLIEFAKAPLVLCGREMTQTLQKTSVTAFTVDENSIARLSARCNNKFPATPNSMGFVVFTSGSTGVPKGIILEHRAYCTAAAAHHESCE